MRFRLPAANLASAAFLVVLLGYLAGCAKHSTRTATFGTADGVLTYGVYTAQNPDAGGMATKLSLSQNNSYARKKFRGSCLMAESRGTWKAESESIEFQLQEIRKRADCTSEDWQVEKVDKSLTRVIRNMTTNSFDLLDQEEDAPAQWIHFVKH